MIKNNQSVPDLMLELADKQIAISKKISSNYGVRKLFGTSANISVHGCYVCFNNEGDYLSVEEIQLAIIQMGAEFGLKLEKPKSKK